jgi:demethylmenaquinone methyltransferase/2-methoxy-6-polyprenyl-1,4-benzoquinol methylase
MPGTDAYLQRLLAANPLREPVLRAAIQALQLPQGSRGLDVGCGPGLQALLLAEATGSAGHVTGADITPAFLTYGERLAAGAGLAARVNFREADMNHLPFADDSFDWVWSADCAGYPAGDLAPALSEFVRVVRPGGRVIILAWSSQQVLPGHPLLEARLNATCSATAPYLQGVEPDRHFLRAMVPMRKAGLENVVARTFAGEVQAPLSDGERAAMLSLFEMLWGQPQPDAATEDWAELQRLCAADSPDLILDIPGYYAFFTYTMFCGRLPARR